jgi:uncharacterized protein (TIGR02271 family)
MNLRCGTAVIMSNSSNSNGANVESVPAVIPVIEEVAYLDKQLVESGKVRVSKRVSEREERIDVPLFQEEIVVKRVPIGEFVDTAPTVREEGDVMIFPVVREEVVVQKRLVLVEELHVRKQIVETRHEESVTLRSEEVDVKRVAES